jgi:SAM-dependent methyltransferase
MTTTVPCLVCGAQAHNRSGYVYSAAVAAGHLCPVRRSAERHALLRDAIDRLWEGADATMYLCSACGFGFARPHVGGDETVYALLQGDFGFPAHRWEYGPVLREMGPGSGGAKCLDVGAGDGTFLRHVAPAWDKFAVEASAAQRECLEEQGVTSVDMGAPAGCGDIDVITMFQALEHIAEFGEVLRWCSDTLRPGGHIYISVPEGALLREWEAATGLRDMPPFHVNQWTRESLARALRQAGFADIAFAADSFCAANVRMLLGHGLLAELQRPESAVSWAWGISDRRVRRAVFTAAAMGHAPKLTRLLLQSPRLCRGVILLSRARRPEG